MPSHGARLAKRDSLFNPPSRRRRRARSVDRAAKLASAMIDDEATVKVHRTIAGRAEFMPRNPALPGVFRVTEAVILGKSGVTFLRHR
jgi:hypothetical protein